MSHCHPRFLTHDGPTRALAAALLPTVQAINPLITSDDIFMGAARVGLNRLCSTTRPITAADLAEEPSTEVLEDYRLIDHEDIDRAVVLSAAFGIAHECILSAAARTGMALLAGIDTLLRPPR